MVYWRNSQLRYADIGCCLSLCFPKCYASALAAKVCQCRADAVCKSNEGGRQERRFLLSGRRRKIHPKSPPHRPGAQVQPSAFPQQSAIIWLLQQASNIKVLVQQSRLFPRFSDTFSLLLITSTADASTSQQEAWDAELGHCQGIASLSQKCLLLSGSSIRYRTQTSRICSIQRTFSCPSMAEAPATTGPAGTTRGRVCRKTSWT